MSGLTVPLAVPPGDVIFPSENKWGIPLLDSAQQLTYLPTPLRQWGTIARAKTFEGTYAFYVDDFKFTALLKHPESVPRTGCRAVVEPNFSLSAILKPAVALYCTYWKRWLACYWQQFYQVRIAVDVNVPDVYDAFNFMGVPADWRSYAVRITTAFGGFAHAERKYAAILRHTGGVPPRLYLVYGGGQETQQRCADYGWAWAPEQIRVAHGLADDLITNV